MVNVQTKTQKDYLQAKTIEYLKTHTPYTLGSKAGVGSKVIDNIINGCFDDVAERHMLQVIHVITEKVMDKIYQTSDATALKNTLEKARKNSLMIGVTGETGTGKTYMMKQLAMKEGVYYIDVHMISSARVFLKELLHKNLRVSCGETDLGALVQEAAKVFNRNEWNTGIKPVLIIDEADKMQKEVRSVIHTLRDRTIDHLGILLVGMPALKNDLLKGKESKKPGVSELYRRIALWVHLNGLDSKEIKTILEDNGISDKIEQREFRHMTGFGDLMNAINLYKLENE